MGVELQKVRPTKSGCCRKIKISGADLLQHKSATQRKFISGREDGNKINHSSFITHYSLIASQHFTKFMIKIRTAKVLPDNFSLRVN